MANNNSQSDIREFVGLTVEVSGHLIGRSLIDDLRRSFSVGSHEQLGDDLMDQSRGLLQRHLSLVELETQSIIGHRITKLVIHTE